ncbi:transcriptional repressor NrdR [Candidatus Woesearchaeota archaeon]|nr:transcriptional repressor NrdR [Candidatus Woesearchaeota archaeon]
MKCPFCLHTETKVVDSRETTDLAATRRRRECLDCEKRFTTYEQLDTVDLAVVKKDGRREAFNKEKLTRGMLKACEKRPIGREKVEASVAAIEAQLRKGDRAEVSSRKVGELVMEQLKKLDHVAYVRFASVYRSFRDISQFEKEIKMLKQQR